jgi:endonuclease/exonuclease/phosphatase family metal-dependent hydrolase
MSEKMNRLRFATWNLRYSGQEHSRRRMRFLKQIDWDVLALQEVSKKAWQVFADSGLTKGGLYTLQGFGLPVAGRAHGVALLVRNGFSLSDPDLLYSNPQRGRTLAARLHGLPEPVNVLSWHAPNAASSGPAFKMRSYKTVIRWLDSVQGPTVIGFDGNHWNTTNKLDLWILPDYDTDPYFVETKFFSGNPPHRLRDALIEFYRSRPELYKQRVSKKPQEPLAVSYVRKPGKTKDRFDYIFISDEFEVIDCRYDYDGATAAGSDHAIVVSKLRV